MSRPADAPGAVAPGERTHGRAGGTDDTDSSVRYCPACDRETLHGVGLAMVSTATDGVGDGNRKFARCPARVVTCRACGAEARSLVNR